jgi:uncharacterized membrane protein YgdD (TMEM256/DUF423 family)
VIGALTGFLAVAFGAFGAHVLQNQLSTEMLQVFETGVRYQMYHALAMLAASLVAGRREQPLAIWAGRLFLIGTLLFSGSLYAIALLEQPQLGMVTPVGGVLLLLGWLVLAVATWQH